MTIPILFCIDTEPDDRLVSRDDPPPWEGLQATHELLTQYRPRFEAATGSPVHYTWFYRLDPQIELCYGSPAWPFTHYRNYLDDFLEAGDEIGLHPHAWRWDDERNAWVADHGNQPWIDECVRMAGNTYADVIGRPPESVRFGDKFYNEASSKLNEELGFRYDLTAEPGTEAQEAIVMDGTELYTGRLGDFTNMPTYPYRRSETDWKKSDNNRTDGMWIIPLSTGVPESVKGRLKRQALSLIGESRPVPRTMTLKAGRHWQTVALLADRILRKLERPYLAFAMRTDDPNNPDKRPHIDSLFEFLINHPRANEFSFSRPGEALEALGLTQP